MKVIGSRIRSANKGSSQAAMDQKSMMAHELMVWGVDTEASRLIGMEADARGSGRMINWMGLQHVMTRMGK